MTQARDIITDLLSRGVTETRKGNKKLAEACFKKVLELDKYNESALMWCATLAPNPFDARHYLQTLLEHHPDNKMGQTYYNLANQRCKELESLLQSSELIEKWKAGSPIRDIPQLGKCFIEAGLLTELQVRAALHYQEYLDKHGQHEKLGQILVSFGYISEQELDEVLNRQLVEYHKHFND